VWAKKLCTYSISPTVETAHECTWCSDRSLNSCASGVKHCNMSTYAEEAEFEMATTTAATAEPVEAEAYVLDEKQNPADETKSSFWDRVRLFVACTHVVSMGLFISEARTTPPCCGMSTDNGGHGLCIALSVVGLIIAIVNIIDLLRRGETVLHYALGLPYNVIGIVNLLFENFNRTVTFYSLGSLAVGAAVGLLCFSVNLCCCGYLNKHLCCRAGVSCTKSCSNCGLVSWFILEIFSMLALLILSLIFMLAPPDTVWYFPSTDGIWNERECDFAGRNVSYVFYPDNELGGSITGYCNVTEINPKVCCVWDY
jgi:hypothetical protein